MKNLRAKENKGFTLIELLVVVAIIGLLSAIVMTALDTSRQKARNSKRNSMALEYINALELYRSENEGYPDVGAVTGLEGLSCIGDWGTDSCFGFFPFTSSSTLNNDLDEFISGPPKNDTPMIVSGLNWSGTVYGCYRSSTSEPCNEYELWWILEGEKTDVDCIRGVNAQDFILGVNSLCKYKSYEDN